MWLELEEAGHPLLCSSLDGFHWQKLHPGEALSVFLYKLKSLLEQTMPDLDAEAPKHLLFHQFLTGLTPAVSRQLRATGKGHDLEKVLVLSLDHEPGESQAADDD